MDALLHLAGNDGAAAGVDVGPLIQGDHLEAGAAVHELVAGEDAGLAAAQNGHVIAGIHVRSLTFRHIWEGLDALSQFDIITKDGAVYNAVFPKNSCFVWEARGRGGPAQRPGGRESSSSTQSDTSTTRYSVGVSRITTRRMPALMMSRRHMEQEVEPGISAPVSGATHTM